MGPTITIFNKEDIYMTIHHHSRAVARAFEFADYIRNIGFRSNDFCLKPVVI